MVLRSLEMVPPFLSRSFWILVITEHGEDDDRMGFGLNKISLETISLNWWYFLKESKDGVLQQMLFNI